MIYLYALLTLAGAFTMALSLTRVMIWLGPKLGLIDRPGERRIHTTPVPQAGGLAVWGTFMTIGLLVILLTNMSGALNGNWYRAFAVASALLVLLGLADDRWGLSPWIKLGVQVVVAAVLFFSKGRGIGNFLGFEVHWSIDLLIWVVWTVGIINAFNLIDGMDGLCGGVAIISVGALVVVSFVSGRLLDGLMMVAMMGAIGGFLRYNIHPARIFLGDTGSMFLGFFIASAATASAGERAVTASLLIPLLVAGVPVIDVILAVWRRTTRKWLSRLGLGKTVKIFGADRDHLHHRLLQLGFSQRKVAMLFYLAAGLASAVAMLPFIVGGQATGITIAAIAVAGMVGLRYIAPLELSTSGAVLHMVLKRPSFGRYLALGFFCYDAFVIVLALAFAFMIEQSGGFDWISRETMSVVAVTLACGLVGLRLAKAHSRHWARASLRDFWALGLWFVVAMNIAFSIMSLMAQDLAWSSGRIFLITTTLSIPLLLLPRSLTPLVREAMVDSLHRRRIGSNGKKKRIVLYGAGDLGELFLSHLKTAPPEEMEEMCIVGFIDDCPGLRQKILDGFPIQGSVSQLGEIAERHDLHGVLLTMTRLDPERAEELNRICDERGLARYRWRPQLQIVEITSQELAEEDKVVVGRHVFQAAADSAPEIISGL